MKISSRKAISPVLATVILIAITLIAAIAVAGFVFNLFGTFTNSAQASTGQITWPASNQINIVVYNRGTVNTQASSLTLTYGGTTESCTNLFGISIIAGQQNLLGANCVPGQTGQSFTGIIYFTNGANVPFVGTFP